MSEIEWIKTPRHEDNFLAKRRVWRSRCGHYKVEESNILYGNGKDRHGNETGYPTCYRAMVHKQYGWEIVSDEYRKRSTAMQALDHFAEHGFLPEKKKRRKRVKPVEEQHEWTN
jgi:hypothetical protein